MDKNIEILFKYLSDIFNGDEEAVLDIDILDQDFKILGEGILYMCESITEVRKFAGSMSKGDLRSNYPSRENELAAQLKALHADLKHMIWQSKQVAKGDYSQKIDFMGEFAEAFNSMIDQLESRQKALVNEIEKGLNKAKALEQSNNMLTHITSNIPQAIVVIGIELKKLLYINKSAEKLIEEGCLLQEQLSAMIPEEECQGKRGIEISLTSGGGTRYFILDSYCLYWNDKKSVAFILSDMSIDREYIKSLEDQAYYDSLTGLYSRAYGMKLLQQLIDEKQIFSLVFIDLDNLKYINDNFGHGEGDQYIRAASGLLENVIEGSFAARLGGDEFMLLLPNRTERETHKIMDSVVNDFKNVPELKEKGFYCDMSFGIVEVDSEIDRSASGILSIADERMYTNKRLHKKQRKKD